MALVISDMSISLDGYVTGPNDSRENPFGDGAEMLARLDVRRGDRRRPRHPVGDARRLRRDRDGPQVIRQERRRRRLGRRRPVGDTPCFVVTHSMPTASHPPVFTFVTDGVVSAIEQAKNAAGDKIVGLHGATIMQQALPLGLVDEIHVHVIPVLLGGGTPLFGTLDASITLERTQALVTPAATHIGFRVVR
jgi:dihydrofolate reductase